MKRLSDLFSFVEFAYADRILGLLEEKYGRLPRKEAAKVMNARLAVATAIKSTKELHGAKGMSKVPIHDAVFAGGVLGKQKFQAKSLDAIAETMQRRYPGTIPGKGHRYTNEEFNRQVQREVENAELRRVNRSTHLDSMLDDVIQFGKKLWPPRNIDGIVDWGDVVTGRAPKVKFNPEIHVVRKNVLNPRTDRRFRHNKPNKPNPLTQFAALHQPRREDEPPNELPIFREGELVDYNVQRHHAKRAGLHRDVRIGNRRHGLLSWATRKQPPNAGEKIAIHQQPTHPHSYLGWSGEIPSGYGAGTVKSEDLGKALVTHSSPDELHATLADRKGSHRLAFIKTKSGWLLSKGQPPSPPKGAAKPLAKSLPPDKAKSFLSTLPVDSSVQPKVDGALVYVSTKGGRPEIFSHRISKTTGSHPIHTERVFRGRPTIDIPREHQRTLVGELYGKVRGKSIPPQQLGGILNAHIDESIRKQKASGVRLKVMPFDVVGDKAPYPARLAKLKETLSHLPKEYFHAPEETGSPRAALSLYEKVKSGQHSLTKEGLIVHEPHGKMTKIKFTKEANVKIGGVFPGTGKFEGHPGGFYYTDKSGKPIGRVGTGFSDETRKELEKYVGRTARIKHQGKYEKSGAYRAPSFIAVDEAR